MQVKTGVKKDGSITGMHFKSFLDGGAYGSYGVASTFYTGALQTVTYDVPRYKFQGVRVFTNKPPCGPKRGHGTPQPRYALEVQLDKIAEQLKLDPAEIRRQHLVKPYSITANYLRIGSMGLGKCIDKVVEGSDWKNKFSGWNKDESQAAIRQRHWHRLQFLHLRRGSADLLEQHAAVGRAAAAGSAGRRLRDVRLHGYRPGFRFNSCLHRRRSPGNRSFRHSHRHRRHRSDAGRSRKLLEPRNVDDRQRRYSGGRKSSRVAGDGGMPKNSAVPIENISLAERRVFDVENPDVGVSFAEAVVLAESKFGTIGTVGSYSPPPSPGKYKGAGVGPSPAYSYSAAVAEVDVDPSTGIVVVERIWIAHDIGQSINPDAGYGPG